MVLTLQNIHFWHQSKWRNVSITKWGVTLFKIRCKGYSWLTLQTVGTSLTLNAFLKDLKRGVKANDTYAASKDLRSEEPNRNESKSETTELRNSIKECYCSFTRYRSHEPFLILHISHLSSHLLCLAAKRSEVITNNNFTVSKFVNRNLEFNRRVRRCYL